MAGFLLILDTVVSGKVRHAFTQKCFETLLQFSFVSSEGGDNSTTISSAAAKSSPGGESAPVSQMAVRTLLTRCSTIINKYNSDVELTRNVPPPRCVCVRLACHDKLCLCVPTACRDRWMLDLRSIQRQGLIIYYLWSNSYVKKSKTRFIYDNAREFN